MTLDLGNIKNVTQVLQLPECENYKRRSHKRKCHSRQYPLLMIKATYCGITSSNSTRHRFMPSIYTALEPIRQYIARRNPTEFFDDCPWDVVAYEPEDLEKYCAKIELFVKTTKKSGFTKLFTKTIKIYNHKETSALEDEISSLWPWIKLFRFTFTETQGSDVFNMVTRWMDLIQSETGGEDTIFYPTTTGNVGEKTGYRPPYILDYPNRLTMTSAAMNEHLKRLRDITIGSNVSLVVNDKVLNANGTYGEHGHPEPTCFIDDVLKHYASRPSAEEYAKTCTILTIPIPKHDGAYKSVAIEHMAARLLGDKIVSIDVVPNVKEPTETSEE